MRSAPKAPDQKAVLKQRRGGTTDSPKGAAPDQAGPDHAPVDKTADPLDPHDTTRATYSLEMAEELAIPRTPLDHEPTSWRKRRSE